MHFADIEADGLLDSVSRLHCAVFKCANTGTWNKFIHGQEKELEDFLSTCGTLVMHNGLGYDKPTLNKLGIKCTNRVIDTLLLSWYLELNRPKHGLASYGEQFGIAKPVVDDKLWATADMRNPVHRDTMLHRCSEDVSIQEALYKHQMKHLNKLYGRDKEAIEKLLKYLEFRGKKEAMKESNQWKLNVPKAEKLYNKLIEVSEGKTAELISVMPNSPIRKKRARPKKYYKKNGDVSATGVTWEALCVEQGVDKDVEEITFIASYVAPKPTSHVQVKDWLYSLGWVPESFKFDRNKETGETRKIPQIQTKNADGDKIMCPSIDKLALVVPEVNALLGYSMVNHRKSFVKAMLESVDDRGYLHASILGYTNTLRSKHTRPLANIPSCRADYGSDIRGLLTCEEGEELVGSDMCSLEDRIKHHYQMPIDPDYVKTQMASDFDPHLLTCVAAGLLTEAQMQAHKDKREDHSALRHVGKGGNYASQYGAGAATIARTCSVDISVGEKIHAGYWMLNSSIKVIAKSTKTKTCDGQKWQLNPVNGFWYHLKSEKDRFSTLVQGTGAYTFDLWIMKMDELCNKAWGKDLPIVGDFH